MPLSQDTSPQAWHAQLDIYRSMSPIQKLNIAFELADTSRALLEAGVRRQYPQYSEDQVHEAILKLWLRDPDLIIRLQEASSRTGK